MGLFRFLAWNRFFVLAVVLAPGLGPLLCPSVRSFFPLFVCSFARLFVRSFVRSFVPPRAELQKTPDSGLERACSRNLVFFVARCLLGVVERVDLGEVGPPSPRRRGRQAKKNLPIQA